MPIKSYIFPASLTCSLLLGFEKLHIATTSLEYTGWEATAERPRSNALLIFAAVLAYNVFQKNHASISSAEQFSPVMHGSSAAWSSSASHSNSKMKQRFKDWHLETVEKSKERNMQTALQPSRDKALQATATPLILRIFCMGSVQGKGF